MLARKTQTLPITQNRFRGCTCQKVGVHLSMVRGFAPTGTIVGIITSTNVHIMIVLSVNCGNKANLSWRRTNTLQIQKNLITPHLNKNLGYPRKTHNEIQNKLDRGDILLFRISRQLYNWVPLNFSMIFATPTISKLQGLNHLLVHPSYKVSQCFAMSCEVEGGVAIPLQRNKPKPKGI